MVAKYGETGDIEKAVLANANRGGENVHSGIVIGSAIGGGIGAAAIPDKLKKGLRDYGAISAEIEAFVAAVSTPTS